ncbi:hypothetical protein KI387_017399, partial [Taxus chinensis]
DEEGTRDMERNEEVGREKIGAISFTKEQITEVVEREAKRMLEALVDQELECSTDIVLEEGEENTDKEHGSMGGGPALIVSFPKGMRSGRRALDTEQRQ